MHRRLIAYVILVSSLMLSGYLEARRPSPKGGRIATTDDVKDEKKGDEKEESKSKLKPFKEIVEGKHDDIPEQAFLYVGTIDEALEKAAEMAKVGA